MFLPRSTERTGVKMVVQEQKVNEIVYNLIKTGHNTIDELVKLKNEYEIDIIEFVEALGMLEDNNLITRTNDKFLISGTFDIH